MRKPRSKTGNGVQKLSLEEKTWVLTLKAGFEIKSWFFKKNYPKSNPVKAEHPSLSLREMASGFTVKYGRSLSRTAIYNILKKQKNAERALAVTNLNNSKEFSWRLNINGRNKIFPIILVV